MEKKKFSLFIIPVKNIHIGLQKLQSAEYNFCIISEMCPAAVILSRVATATLDPSVKSCGLVSDVRRGK